ncbi:MAG: dynamin family protein [Leptolyngbyaceae cyanobacterium SL_5_14]|nr:dynamin family protein [Leptolyngbyaceae cyanobacterium SL_5_14]
MEFVLHSSAPVTALGEDRQLVLTLVQNLKYLHRIAKTLNLPTRDIEDALVQVENQTLSVVVVGEFKRGKSTFINALLGHDILPSDILPTTAAINRVVFGSTPSATVRFKDGQDQSIAIEQLVNYVTKLTSDAEAISSRVQEALIHYPLHYCRNGVEIIDTPGLSDDENMTEVTLSVLRRTEVVIMVTSAISPFAESEGVFLTEMLLEQGIDHILFVVNGIDHFKQSEDVDRVLQSITQRIKKHIHDWADRQFGEGTQEYNAYMKRMGIPRIYGLSSQQALQAKRTRDSFLLERSRFQEFEASLNCLLTEERQRISLQMAMEGAIAAANQILDAIKAQRNALQLQQQSFEKQSLNIVESITTLRKQSREDLDHTVRGIANIESEVETILRPLSYRLEQAIEQEIDSTSVDMSSNLNGITSHFANQVVSALRVIISSIESDITRIVKRETEEQSLKLKIITNSIDKKICQIQDQCLQIKIDLTINDSVYQYCNNDIQTSLQRLTNVLSVDSNLFFIQESAKGGYTVTGAVIGSLFGGFGAPVGAAIGASLGEQRRKQTFKQFYKPAVLSVMKAQLSSQNINQKVNQYVVTATSNLKASAYKVRQQTEVIIDGIEQNFATFQGKRDAEALAEKSRLEQLSSEIQKILDQTNQLLTRLD